MLDETPAVEAGPAGWAVPAPTPTLTLLVRPAFWLGLPVQSSSSISLGELLTALVVVVVVVTLNADEMILTSAVFTQLCSGRSPKYGHVQTAGNCR